MDRMTVAEGQLKGYAQFANSDCLNGGVIQVRNGHRLMDSLASHHYVLLVGHHLADIRMVSKALRFSVEQVD